MISVQIEYPQQLVDQVEAAIKDRPLMGFVPGAGPSQIRHAVRLGAGRLRPVNHYRGDLGWLAGGPDGPLKASQLRRLAVK